MLCPFSHRHPGLRYSLGCISALTAPSPPRPAGSGPRAPSTALPMGAVSAADPLRLQALPLSLDMLQVREQK
jgi:hypothetical protein